MTPILLSPSNFGRIGGPGSQEAFVQSEARSISAGEPLANQQEAKKKPESEEVKTSKLPSEFKLKIWLSNHSKSNFGGIFQFIKLPRSSRVKKFEAIT